jgi:hypothetical protein
MALLAALAAGGVATALVVRGGAVDQGRLTRPLRASVAEAGGLVGDVVGALREGVRGRH